MSAQFISPPSLCPTFGWTHVVTTSGGRTVHISGQVALDAAGQLVGPGDLRRQAEQAFENLRLALAAVGATFQQVVNTRLYVVGLQPQHVPIIREVRSRYVDPARPPASTLVGVTALVGPEWLIEIEALAHIAD